MLDVHQWLQQQLQVPRFRVRVRADLADGDVVEMVRLVAQDPSQGWVRDALLQEVADEIRTTRKAAICTLTFVGAYSLNPDLVPDGHIDFIAHLADGRRAKGRLPFEGKLDEPGLAAFHQEVREQFRIRFGLVVNRVELMPRRPDA